jgi:hypothetical protein
MHNYQHNPKTHNMSKLLVIGLSIILITGISFVPTLQIGVQGQVQQQQSPLEPPSPGGSPSSGSTSPPSLSPERPPSPGGSPSSGSTSPPSLSPERPPSPGGSPSSGTSPQSSPTTRPALGAEGSRAANQTGAADNQTAGGGAVNQSAMVMIPQGTMEMIMSQLQDAMIAVDSNNKDNATKLLNSVDQELKSAANASGISIETTTG